MFSEAASQTKTPSAKPFVQSQGIISIKLLALLPAFHLQLCGQAYVVLTGNSAFLVLRRPTDHELNQVAKQRSVVKKMVDERLEAGVVWRIPRIMSSR